MTGDKDKRAFKIMRRLQSNADMAPGLAHAIALEFVRLEDKIPTVKLDPDAKGGAAERKIMREAILANLRANGKDGGFNNVSETLDAIFSRFEVRLRGVEQSA